MNFNDLIISEMPRLGRGWSGGCTVANGSLIEAGGKERVLAVRDMDTGTILRQIKTDIPTSIHDISYDPFTATIWCSPGGGLQQYWQISMDGKKLRTIPRPDHGFGIFCDREDPGVMWCADQEHCQIACISTVTGAGFVRHVPLSFPPRGVAKDGENFWVTLAGELDDPKGGHLYRVDASGNILNDFPLPRSRYAHDAGGLTLDDKGRLWLCGGKGLPIYCLDISKATGEITPPITPEEDSTIKDILARLETIEAWIEAMKELFKL